MFLSPKLKPKIKIVVLLFVFCFTLLPFSPARAQLPVYDPMNDFWNMMREFTRQAEEAATKVENTFIDSLMVGTMKGFEYLMNKLAYDLAVSLASGNWGQSPLFHTKSVGDYLAGVTSDAIGTALDNFTKGIGFNLCQLPDIKLDLALKLGLHLAYSEPKPDCTFQQLRDTWSLDNIRSQYWGENGENFARRFNTSLDISQTDMGIGMIAKAKIDAYALKAEADAKAQREEGKGAKPLSALITGGILTPADVNADMLRKASKANQLDKQADRSAADIRAGLQAGSVQVLINAASTFINAFAGTALDNFLTKGMFPFGLGKIKCVPSYLKIGGLNIDTCVDTKYDAAGNLYGGTESSWKQEAATLFAEELLVTKARTMETYDLLSKFTSCGDTYGPENCVMDENFAQAVRQAQTGKPLTIQQAIDKYLIDPNWPLVAPIEKSPGESLHASKDCYEKAFCYKNIKVLRKARVLPLGFEIATLIPPVNDKLWTLKDALDGFYNPDSPFYHLINPNWVLKIPPARCKSVVYGTQLVGDTPVRQEECADLQSCVGYDKTGKCIAYGYCLKEKNVWRFDADYCEKEYATCKTMSNSAGKTVSYLTRTLNKEECSAENVGCRFYSDSKIYPGNNFASGTWGGTNNSLLGLTGYYLDKDKVTCESKDAGCSALALEPTSTSSLLYFKKAPDYLRCYDSDLNTAGVQWPTTMAEFNKIKPINEEACKNYAPACIPEEVGCNEYTLQPLVVFGGLPTEKIIGKFTPASTTGNNQIVTAWNDECDASCVGYNSYKELKTRYSNGADLVYIIPTTIAKCEESEVGCSAFVNLQATSGGMEQTEYYSNLRLCALPDQNKQKNFYTYQGKADGGYTLESFTFLKDATGAPKQLYRDDEEYNRLKDACNSSTLNIDCREFIDEQGNKHYAFLSKTVVVSPNCTPYRAVKSEFFSSTKCLGSYDPKSPNKLDNDKVVFYDQNSGYCIYYGLPKGIYAFGEGSVSCSKDKVSCRPYKGSTGNFVKTILDEDFEKPEKDLIATTNLLNMAVWGKTWDDNKDPNTFISLSTESLTQGGHSLKTLVNASTASGTKRFYLDMVPGRTYKVSFIAKGNGTWGIRFYHALNNYSDINGKSMDFTLTDNWRRYEFTFVAVASRDYPLKATTTHFTLRPSATVETKIFYLDDVLIQEITDTINLVKDKLFVPTVCDENQIDNLPGQALGCREYKTPTNQSIYIHNFSYLCREGAVGCAKVFDTRNRELSGDTVNKYLLYNLWLSKSKFGKSADFSGTLSDTIAGTNLSCFVEKDQSGCYVPKVFATATVNLIGFSQYFSSSTIIIPPRATTPIYLVLNPKKNPNHLCRVEQKGCTALGSSVLVDNKRKYEDVYLKITPETIDSALCNDRAEGCDVWSAGAAKYYFKDPEVYGNKIYEWKKDNNGIYHWYLKNTTTVFVEFLPSFGSTVYQNQIGSCPSDQDGCTQFIDRYAVNTAKTCTVSGKKCMMDKDCTSDPNDYCVDSNKEYYLLNNSKITDAQKKCEGKVSLSAGCILLDKTDNPVKIWNTELSYNASNNNQGNLVLPSEAEPKDANIIMQVTLDRECSLWAYCNTYMTEVNPDTGKISGRCYSLGLCDKAKSGGGDDYQCAHPIATTTESGKVLTKDVYIDRSVLWNAEEFTGYSTFNSYQLYDLQVRTLKTKNKEVNLLVHPEPNKNPCTVEDKLLLGGTNKGCTVNGISGYCSGQECILPAKPYKETDIAYTQALPLSDNNKSSPTLSCRGYPEKDSPFDPWVLKPSTSGDLRIKEFRTGINENVNLCAAGSCDCNYKKYTYGGKTVYLGADATNISNWENGICIGGKWDGQPTSSPVSDTDKPCGQDATFSPLKSKKAVYGWEGYCLENDSRFYVYRSEIGSEPTCLTWWPVEVAKGSMDLWIYDENAGWEVTDKSERKICAYNTSPQTRTEHSATWTKDNGSNKKTETYPNSQIIGKDKDSKWYVPNDTTFTNGFGDLEYVSANYFSDKPISIFEEEINGSCGNGSYNGNYISWQGNYMSPYYIQGYKGGCEINNDDQYIGSGENLLLIKNLPPNAKAYYIDANKENSSFVVSDLDKVDKNSITKIEVLISDSVKSGIEENFDNNRLIFYNKTFFECQDSNMTNNAFSCDNNIDYFVSSTYIKSDNSVYYEKLNDSAWGLVMKKNQDSNVGFIVKIEWKNDKLDNLVVDAKEIEGYYKIPDNLFYCEDDGGERWNMEGYCEKLRGMAFIFIVHYSDGTCSDQNKIIVKNTLYSGKFTSKPTTWRLWKDKINITPSSNSSAFIFTFDELLDPTRKNAVFYFNPQTYQEGYQGRIYARIKNLPAGGFGRAGSGNNNFLNSYRDFFDNKIEPEFLPSQNVLLFFGRISKKNQGGVALVNYDFSSKKDQDTRFYIDLNSSLPDNCKTSQAIVCKMFKNVFVKGWLNNGSVVIDFANPKNAKDNNIDIHPPVIAAPITLSSSECDIKTKKCLEAKDGTDCYSSKFCESFQLGTFALGQNNKTSGNLEISYNTPLILRFYAWADPAQMPLRRIMVDKGNGDIITLEADSVGNRKPLCTFKGWCGWNGGDAYKYQIPCNNSSDCVFKNQAGTLIQGTCNTFNPSNDDPGGYGNALNEGCRQTMYEFFLSGLTPSDTGYRPRVQVLDNWGWCSGECKDAANGALYSDNGINYGCYAEVTQQRDDCRQDNNWAWINYNGNVVVK